MNQRAEVIVRALIANSETKWIGNVIYTEYNLVVQETLKGSASSSITVTLPGGSIGNVALAIPGTPQLAAGNEIVFFGEGLTGQASFKPVGIFDGIIPVQQGVGSEPTVAPRGQQESLDEFLDEVRALGGNR